MIKFCPIFVGDVQLITHPFWPQSFEFGVEVAFVVRDVLWLCVRVSVAVVFGTVFAAGEIALPFLVCLPSAALRPALAATLSLCRWWGRGT